MNLEANNSNAQDNNTRNLCDCHVLFVSEEHATYRGVLEALTPMGLNVMWARDLDSAKMLARTTRMKLLLCDSKIKRNKNKLFEPSTIQPGTSCLEMRFPAPDPKGERFERNIYRARRLIRLVRNLTQHPDHNQSSQQPSFG